MPLSKCMIFVDGENLTYRFQSMVTDGKIPKATVQHQADTYVWTDDIVRYSAWHLIRVPYYTSAVGDEPKIRSIEEQLKAIRYNHQSGFGFLNPHVFKKQKRGDKTKSVDINLVTDLLRHAYNESIDEVCVLTGDGDYLPAVRDIMRKGIRVSVGAFSSGLDSRLRTQSDEFIDLDPMYFQADGTSP
ncbi:MAG TPA: NYN domain-containing protein [Trinickia sp.]|uniref:NYN domain-containing protein n=1 Tax=Trinickia sp. TaxID=2571163 RepID=UPI002B51ACEC|nr:NYN domain-containing protein [Trinickia sp.]HVW49178.1 NYN domain-containing protein [Trinickia sp.]